MNFLMLLIYEWETKIARPSAEIWHTLKKYFGKVDPSAALAFCRQLSDDVLLLGAVFSEVPAMDNHITFQKVLQ